MTSSDSPMGIADEVVAELNPDQTAPVSDLEHPNRLRHGHIVRNEITHGGGGFTHEVEHVVGFDSSSGEPVTKIERATGTLTGPTPIEELQWVDGAQVPVQIGQHEGGHPDPSSLPDDWGWPLPGDPDVEPE